MATYTFTLTNPAGSTFTITTSDTPKQYQPYGGGAGTGPFTGYAITGITGTFNGAAISGLLPSNNNMTNPITNDSNNTGGNIYQYENVFYLNNSQGFKGSVYGFDAGGMAFTAGGVDYAVYHDTDNGANRFAYYTEAGGAQPITVLTTNACYVTGTCIRTERGNVAVEDLRVGDFALTASGLLRPIVWIGHRDLGSEILSLHNDKQPVRVRARAFGSSLPVRDLLLSPGHSVLVGAEADCSGGVLVPIMCLINGTSIARDRLTAVTYWHVELEAHDILLAEGLPAESYLDWGDRPFFEEASDHALHNPDFVVPGLASRCRPVAVDGPLVEAERKRLDALFEAELAGHGMWDAAGDWLAA